MTRSPASPVVAAPVPPAAVGRKTPRSGRLRAVSWLCITLSAAPAIVAMAAQEKPPVNEFAEAMAAFRKRVDAYLDVRSAATRGLPEVKETGDPNKISTREKALGEAIAKARASARAGDVFGDLSPYLQRILAEDWKSRSAADRKALLGEVPRGLALKVNQAYPTTIALASVPPRLLARLPTLPEALEYRLVDNRLLLRDRDANVIVDVLLGVQPKG